MKTRKPGGGRRPSKPDYDAKAILQIQMDKAVVHYNSRKSLNIIAKELSMNPIKVRKLLITAGVYQSDVADRVLHTFQELFQELREGQGYKDDEDNTDVQKHSYTEIYKAAVTLTMNALKLSRASVTSYLPYEKGVYFTTGCRARGVEGVRGDTRYDEDIRENLSVGAERIRRMRVRQKSVEKLRKELDKGNSGADAETALWSCILAFQHYPFHTASGLPFTYKLKIGRDGEYTKELFIDRRENSKSLSWSSVRLAFRQAVEKMADKMNAKRDIVFDRPKAVADVRGISYVYPLLWRFGVIRVPVEVEEKLKNVSR